MAVDFNGQTSGTKYAYYTIGSSGSGSSLVTAHSPLSVFAKINIAASPLNLGSCIGACVNMPLGFGGYNKQGMFITQGRLVQASAGGTVSHVTQHAYSATAMSLNEWFCAGASIAQNSVTAYLDGVPGTENTGTWSISNALEETIIGAYPVTTPGEFNRPFSGCIQDLAFWDVKLTDEQQAELATLSSAEIAAYDPAPILYVPFVDAATADEAVYNGSPFNLLFKIYNANPSDTTATVDDCASSPEAPGTPAETGEDCAEDFADTLQTAIPWPTCVLVPSRIQVDLLAPSVSPGRSFAGFEQIVQADPGHWRITFHEIPIRTKAHALQWRDIEGQLNGRNGVVLVPVYEGKLSDEAIAATAGDDYPIGTTSISIEQSAGAILRAGMHFTHDDWLYRIKRIVEQETGEAYEVVITPPLRAAMAASESLDFNDPHCRCRLERDDSMDVNLELLRFARPSVTFVEDV